MADTDAAPKTDDVGLGLAIAWLALSTLGCLGTVVVAIDPQVGTHVALVTVPAFVSGWGAVGAAIPTRKRGLPTSLLAPLGGMIGGFVVGFVALWVVYVATWPDLG